MTGIVPTEVFARDLWEALRQQCRKEVDEAVSEDDFNATLPPWEDLDWEIREAKVRIARDDLLKVLDRAGYQVHRVGRSAAYRR